MKSKFIFSLVLLTEIFSVNIANAQTFKWGQTAKVKNSFYQYYIGESAAGSLLLFSKYTIRKDFKQNTYNFSISLKSDNEISLAHFDKNQNFVSANPFSFKNTLSVFYEAFVSDNIYFIYSSIKNNKCILFADVYSIDEKFIRTESIRELTKYSSNENDVSSNFTIISSEENEYFAVQGMDNLITFHDNHLKKAYEYKFTYKFLADMEVKDNGYAYAIAGSDKSATLISVNIKEKKISTAEIGVAGKNNVENFCLTSDEKQNIIYVTYSYGIPGDKIQIYFGPMRHVEFYANGICAEIFDMKTLESKKKMSVPFSDETLLKVSEKKKVEKVKGLEWFSNKKMYITENGELIMVLEKEYTLTTSYYDQTMRTQKTEYSTVDEDIICLKINIDGSSEQNVIKRKTKDQSVYDYMLSCATFYEKGKLYVMYNEKSGGYKFVNHAFTEDMKDLKTEEHKTYKEHDVYLSIRNAKKMKDGDYKVFGREGKNVSAVAIKF